MFSSLLLPAPQVMTFAFRLRRMRPGFISNAKANVQMNKYFGILNFVPLLGYTNRP